MSILEGKFLKFDKCPALNNCTGTKNFLNPILGAQIQTSFSDFGSCQNVFSKIDKHPVINKDVLRGKV